MASHLTFVKKRTLFDKVVFVDGVGYSGKFMLGPLLSTYRGVELHRLDTIFEYIAALQAFGKITMDAATAMMRYSADEYLYNSMIGRGVNFRPTDESSVFTGRNQERYLSRLFDPTEGDALVQRIKTVRPVFQVLTHEILSFAEPCFEAFGPRFFVLEMLRHPVVLVERWLNSGCGKAEYDLDPRTLILTVESGRRAVPYYAASHRKGYFEMSPEDRVIRDVRAVTKRVLDCYHGLSADRRKRVLFIRFEDFVTKPDDGMRRVARFLGLRPGPHLQETMKAQRIPRELPAGQREQCLSRIAAGASREGMRILDQMSREYETMEIGRP